MIPSVIRYQQDNETSLIYFLEPCIPNKLTIHSESIIELYAEVAYVCCEYGLNL